ncbi:hypothetical protein Hte_003663 [Hypoxylon texense]
MGDLVVKISMNGYPPGAWDDAVVKIPINPHRPGAWADAILQIISLVKCPKDCLLVPDGLPPLHVTGRRPSIRTSDSTKTEIGIGIFDIPIEILTQIFEYVVEGYSLLGYLRINRGSCFDGNLSTQLIFHKPRTWADNTFSISRTCRAFRNLAAEYYGVPRQYVIPFSPKLDTLLLFGHSLTFDDAVHAPIVNLPSWDENDSWLLHNGVYSTNMQYANHVEQPCKLAILSAEFLQRPRKVVLKVDSGRPYGYGIPYLVQDRAQILNFIGETFTNTQVFKMIFNIQDECKRRGRKKDVGNYYTDNHIHFLEGLIRAVERSSASTFFPNLKTLEVKNVEYFCSARESYKVIGFPTQLLEQLRREAGRDADSTRDPAL